MKEILEHLYYYSYRNNKGNEQYFTKTSQPAQRLVSHPVVVLDSRGKFDSSNGHDFKDVSTSFFTWEVGTTNIQNSNLS